MPYSSGGFGTTIERRMNAYVNSVTNAYESLNNNRKKIFVNRISSKPFVENVNTNNMNGVELVSELSS